MKQSLVVLRDLESIDFHSMGPESRSSGVSCVGKIESTGLVRTFKQGVLQMRWFILAVAVPLLAVTGGTAGASEIRPVHTEKCLDVTGASIDAGTRIIQFVCRPGASNQNWFIRSAGGGTVQIASAHNGMCLDVDGASTADRAAIIQFPCKDPKKAGSSNQKFTMPAAPGSIPQDPRVVIRNVHSGKCLDIENGSAFDGAGLIQFTCLRKQPNQQFRIR